MIFKDIYRNLEVGTEEFKTLRRKQYIPQGAVVYLTEECTETISKLGKHIQTKGRPWVVISNLLNNTFSPNVTLVSLTTSSTKVNIPTHVKINSVCDTAGDISTVLCEMPITVGKENISKIYKYLLSESEVEAITKGIAVQVSIIEEREKKYERRKEFNKKRRTFQNNKGTDEGSK